MSIVDDPAVTVCFAISIDDSNYDLGLFNTCDGLGCEVTVEQRQEGGTNGFSYQLPGPMKFTNVKFTRPINADSAKVAAWISASGPGMYAYDGGGPGTHLGRDSGVQLVVARCFPREMDRPSVQRRRPQGGHRNPRDRPSRVPPQCLTGPPRHTCP